VDVGEVRLDELQRFVERTFRHVAETKGLTFEIRMDPRLPKAISTDAKRLQQILRNLLSNAFKFTHKGEVNLMIRPAEAGWSGDNEDLNRASDVLEFSVSDTGIGIPTDKQQIIFEAFQQADGSTSRKYGGTGLGLAISRELSRLLRGEIRLVSAPNKGSVFSLYLPQAFPPSRLPRKSSDAAAVASAAIEAARQAAERRLLDKATFDGYEEAAEAIAQNQASAPVMLNEAEDDRDAVHPGDRVVLIVENDLAFAKVLLESAREQGFKGIVTTQGTTALSLINEFHPSAILLDIHLPDIEGWRVLSRLKNDITVRHIPVHVISTDESRGRALDSGARRFVAKPLQSRKAVDQVLEEIYQYTTTDTRRLLLVEPDPARMASVSGYLSQLENVEVIPVSDGARAAQLLREGAVDCAVVNPDTPDLDLAALMDEVREAHTSPPPVIAYGRRLPASVGAASVANLDHIAGVQEVHSLERLLDQVVMALHIDMTHVKEPHRKVLDDIYGSTKALAGRRVLIVDDDIRNIFALSSVLEDYGMEIKTADNGREAIDHARRGELDIILMDIMMPEMDGLETTKEIRKIPTCKDLPIVAVTAKAMKGDRERCIEAGAWDYLSKPVDREQLLTVLKAWLQK
jgi:CheY-like chemotaxis protein